MILSQLYNRARNWDFLRKNGYPTREELFELLYAPKDYFWPLGVEIRAMVTLYVYEGLSLESVAQSMGRTRERVRQCLSKARRSGIEHYQKTRRVA